MHSEKINIQFDFFFQLLDRLVLPLKLQFSGLVKRANVFDENLVCIGQGADFFFQFLLLQGSGIVSLEAAVAVAAIIIVSVLFGLWKRIMVSMSLLFSIIPFGGS